MRLFWRADLTQPYAGASQERVAATPEDANLVSSLTAKGTHMPAIDLDVPCRLVPSSTEGHFHLFIDVEVEREKYWAILKALYEAGIVEEGFYQLSVERGASFLRTHRKGERDHMIYPETNTPAPAPVRAWRRFTGLTLSTPHQYPDGISVTVEQLSIPPDEEEEDIPF